MIVTVVGSRNISSFEERLLKCTCYSLFMSDPETIFRSGAADGADSTIENCGIPKENLNIFLPWDGFNGRFDSDGDHIILPENLDNYPQAQEIAVELHGLGWNMGDTLLKFHSRNVYQPLGVSLDKPSDVTIFCADESLGGVSGGTATAVKLSRDLGIPCYNFRKTIESIRFLDDFCFNKKEVLENVRRIDTVY